MVSAFARGSSGHRTAELHDTQTELGSRRARAVCWNIFLALFGALCFLCQAHWDPSSGTVEFGWQSAHAQTVQYIYDETGRLTGTIDNSGNAAQYNYDAAGNITSIVRTASSAVSILEFSPNSGPVGTVVTIWGTGFSATPASNTVRFNGTAAAVSSASVNKLVVTVPAGATTGTISVTSPSGSATSATSFTVGTASGAPTISSFTPTIGVVGTAVTVNGTNFDPVMGNDKVWLNITTAAPTSATATQIQTAVPGSSASGHWSVSTPSGSVTSTADFFVVPSGFTLADVITTGRITVDGADLPVSVGTANKLGMIVFDGLKGQRVRLIMSPVTFSNMTMTLIDPYGIQIKQQGLIGTTGDTLLTPVLPRTATYTLMIAPGTGVGSMTLSAKSVTSIAVDGSGVSYNWTRSGENAAYTFQGTAGQRLGLGLSGLSITSPGYGYLSIIGPVDASLLPGSTYFDVSSGTTYDAAALPSTGAYTIRLDPYQGATGSATLTVSNEITGTLTIGGAPVTFTTVRPGQNGRYAFNNPTNQRIAIVVSSSSFTTSNYILLYDSTGTQIGGATLGTNQVSDYLGVLAAGDYSLFVTPTNASTGSATFSIVPTLTGSISVPGSVPLTLGMGQNARYTFSGTAGQNMGLGVSIGSMTGSLVGIGVYSSTGAYVANSGNNIIAPGTVGASYDFKLPTTDTYTIVVDPYQAATSNLTLTLTNDLSVGSLAIDGAAGTYTTASPGQNGRFTVSGTANDYLNLIVSNVTFASGGSVSMYRADGTTPFGSGTSLNNGTPPNDLPVLPATETYTILVSPAGSATGSATLKLVKSISGTLTAGGSSTTFNWVTGQNARYTFTASAGDNLGLGIGVGSLLSGEALGISILNPSGGSVTGGTLLPPATAGASYDLSNLVAGTYLITLNPLYATAAGNVTLTLSADTPNTAMGTTGTPVTYSTTRPGQKGRYTFSCTSGTYVTVAVTAGSTFTGGGTIQIVKPDKTVLSGGSFNSAASSFNSAAFPASGTCNVVVKPGGAYTGSVTFSLTAH